jgi:hypothetical protein
VTLLVVVVLMAMFIIYPQVRVVLVPGVEGYSDFFRADLVKPLRNSLQVMMLSTTTAVLLGFIYAYAMVYSQMPWKPFFRLIGIPSCCCRRRSWWRRVTFCCSAARHHHVLAAGPIAQCARPGRFISVQTIAFFPSLTS